MPVEGGEEERVLEQGVFGRWALSRSGIYLLDAAGPDQVPAITLYQYETWEPKTIMTFSKGSRFGIANSLTVTPDDRWIVYAKYDQTAADLMLVRNFSAAR